MWTPLFYCLMPRKMRDVYSRLYSLRFNNCVLFYLKMNLQLLEREGLQFPENVPVMEDFEVFGTIWLL